MPTTFSPFGNQKILGSPGDAGDVRSILPSGGNVIGFIPFGMILPVIWPKNGESFTDPAS